MNETLIKTEQSKNIFGIYIAEVVDVENNKIMVKIWGINHDTPSTTSLLQARLIHKIGGTDDSHTGSNSIPPKGTMVYIQFIGGEVIAPLIIGMVGGDDDFDNESRGIEDIFVKKRKEKKQGVEKNPIVGKYPYIESNHGKGYSVIYDDTPDAPQVKIQLISGTHIELSKDDIQIKAIGEFRTIVKKDWLLSIGGKVALEIGGSYDVSTTMFNLDGSMKISGDLTVTGTIKGGIIQQGIIILGTHGHATAAVGKPSGPMVIV